MKRTGNIMFVFILLVAMAVVTISFLVFVSGGLRGAAGSLNHIRVFYIAEAGINKAVWNLMTSPGQGGHGTLWRTPGVTEQYGGGIYTFSIQNAADPQTISIISTAELAGIQRGISVNLVANKFPSAFDYALFNNGDLLLQGSVSINGDVYADGNMVIKNPAEVLDGTVTVADGSTISGNGEYTIGDSPDDPPQMPAFDRTYYENEILFAGSGDPVVLQGNQTFSNYNLGGDTIYVNGDVTVSGNLTGGGKIVSTGKVTIQNGSVNTDTVFISDGELKIGGISVIENDSLFYSGTAINSAGTSRMGSTFLAPTMFFGGNDTVYGLIYCWETGAKITGNVDIYGSISNFSDITYTGNITINHNPQYLPGELPPGMESGGYGFLAGSWREL